MTCRARSWTEEPNKSSPDRSAFTLLEMVVVLALMAIIAGATVLSLQPSLQRARLKRVLASIEDADHRARTEARRSSETIELTIDGRNRAATQTPLNGRGESTRSLPFSGGIHIDRFDSVGQSTSDDRFKVRIGPDGQSHTYAVRLKTNRSDRQSRHTWLVVVGATGQYVRSNEDSVVEAIVTMQR